MLLAVIVVGSWYDVVLFLVFDTCMLFLYMYLFPRVSEIVADGDETG
jgi:hypothetical protein